MLASTASRSLRSRVSVRIFSSSSLGHAVEALRDGGELLGPRHGQLVAEVAGREALGALPHLAHLPADAARARSRPMQRGHEGHGPPRSARCASTSASSASLTAVSGIGGAHDGLDRSPARAAGRRRTSCPRRACRCSARTGPRRRSQRRLELGPVAMVLHLVRRPVARVRQHEAERRARDAGRR